MGLGAANDVMSRSHGVRQEYKGTGVWGLGSGPYFDTRRCLGLSDVLFILGYDGFTTFSSVFSPSRLLPKKGNTFRKTANFLSQSRKRWVGHIERKDEKRNA